MKAQGSLIGRSVAGGQNPLVGGCAGSSYPFLTSYERDNETILDFAEARYYSSAQGRFIRPDPYNIFFEMKVGRNARERARMLRAYISEPQSWNRYSYCLNDPVNLIDPSGLIWLTQNNESYIWVDDVEYENNKDSYKDYSVANGAIISYQGSSDCDQCQGLKAGDLVQLNENGKVDHLVFGSDPNTTVYDGGTYTSYTLGYRIFQMGGIVDSSSQVYPTFGFGPSLRTYSISQTEGQGPVNPGIFLQGSVANGLAINESLNLLHPTAGLSREVGGGTPNAGVSIQVVLPALQGTTPHDWAYHPDNPRRQGLMWHTVGRCPY